MRILFASSSSGSRGGGELYLITLGEALAKRGHEVLLWVSTNPRMDEIVDRFQVFGKVVRSPYTNTYDYRTRCLATCWNFSTSARIATEWKQLKPDILHVNKQNLEDGLDLLRAAGKSAIPNVCTIHLTQNARYLRAVGAGLRDMAATMALRKYRGTFITIQEPRARELEKVLGPRGRVTVIHNGVSVGDPGALRTAHRDRTRQAQGIGEGQLLISALGRMTGQKRPLLFLEYAKAILARIPEARFLWIGDGSLTGEWDTFVANNGLRPFVTRLGWQSDPTPFLAASDVFLHVADYESFLPLALLEAMAMKLPCAITENLIDDIPLLKTTEPCTLPIRQDWINGLKDRASLQKLAEAGFRLVESRFSLPKVAADYEQLYKSVAS